MANKAKSLPASLARCRAGRGPPLRPPRPGLTGMRRPWCRSAGAATATPARVKPPGPHGISPVSPTPGSSPLGALGKRSVCSHEMGDKGSWEGQLSSVTHAN